MAAAADLAARVVAERLAFIADRLIETKQLRPGLQKPYVERVLRFYFGFEAWRTLRSIGWDWTEAGDWLSKQAATALLPNQAGGESKPMPD